MVRGLGLLSIRDPLISTMRRSALYCFGRHDPHAIMIRAGDRRVPCLLTRIRDGNKRLSNVHRALGTFNGSISTIQGVRVRSLASRQKQRTQGRWASLDVWDVSRQTWRRHHRLVDDYISISGPTARVSKSQEKARKKTHQRQNCWSHHCSP